MTKQKQGNGEWMRIGEAAELLGVSGDTIRRWSGSGRIAAERTAGGQRLVRRADVARLVAERRVAWTEPAIVAQSARNRFAGVVTRVVRDRAAATVEVQAGPHRLVSLITREAADELRLEPGHSVVCVVKATDVIVELPER